MEEVQYRRYFIRLSYEGTNFCGWQFQKNNESVQESIEKVLTLLCKTPQKILGCGRTDAGVHADDFYAHWDYPFALPDKLLMKMNSLLSRSVAIKEIFEVQERRMLVLTLPFANIIILYIFTKIHLKDCTVLSIYIMRSIMR
jgi:tRNA U38,U39,U40 pseudouridine synthase TruA